MANSTENLFTNLNSSQSSDGSYLTEQERIILTVILTVLTTLAFLENGIVICTILYTRGNMDVPANIFIVSQAFADLGTVLTLPIYMSHMYAWNWDVVYIIITFTWFASLGSLFLLTFNRVISVASPLRYAVRLTPVRAKILVSIVWLAALIISLLHLIGYVVFSDSNFFNYGRYYIITLIIVVLVSNVYMFCESRKQKKKISQSNRLMTGLQQNLKDDFKSAKTLVLVGGTFLLSCLPTILVIFVKGNEKGSVQFQRWTAFMAPMLALNPVVDPLIYYLRSTEFRSRYQRFKRLCGREIKPNRRSGASTLAFINIGQVHPMSTSKHTRKVEKTGRAKLETNPSQKSMV